MEQNFEPSTRNSYKVCYAFPISHKFRVPFHDELRKQLSEADIIYTYVGAKNSSNTGKGDTQWIDWAEDCPTKKIRFFGRTLIWQNLLPHYFNSDLLIIQQENKHIVNYILILLSSLFRKKVAYFGHGRNFQSRHPSSLAERWKKLWSKKVDWWFAYTEETKRILIGNGYDSKKITVFNNSVDTMKIKDELNSLDCDQIESLRDSLVNGSKNVAVYVGGLYREKRIPFLLESAREIRSRIDDFHLIVIGGGEDAVLVKNANEDWIHYMGPQFGIEKTSLIEISKIWLMPGLVGLAVLDSFAYKKPMITCDLPFHSPEISYLIDGFNGVIVKDAHSIHAYASAAVELLVDDDKRSLIATGADTSSNNYTIEKMARLFADGVRSALES